MNNFIIISGRYSHNLPLLLKIQSSFSRIKASLKNVTRHYSTMLVDSMMMLDLNGKILTINQREEEIIGYKMGELIGKYIYDFFTKDIKEIHFKTSLKYWLRSAQSSNH